MRLLAEGEDPLCRWRTAKSALRVDLRRPSSSRGRRGSRHRTPGVAASSRTGRGGRWLTPRRRLDFGQLRSLSPSGERRRTRRGEPSSKRRDRPSPWAQRLGYLLEFVCGRQVRSAQGSCATTRAQLHQVAAVRDGRRCGAIDRLAAVGQCTHRGGSVIPRDYVTAWRANAEGRGCSGRAGPGDQPRAGRNVQTFRSYMATSGTIGSMRRRARHLRFAQQEPRHGATDDGELALEAAEDLGRSRLGRSARSVTSHGRCRRDCRFLRFLSVPPIPPDPARHGSGVLPHPR